MSLSLQLVIWCKVKALSCQAGILLVQIACGPGAARRCIKGGKPDTWRRGGFNPAEEDPLPSSWGPIAKYSARLTDWRHFGFLHFFPRERLQSAWKWKYSGWLQRCFRCICLRVVHYAVSRLSNHKQYFYFLSNNMRNTSILEFKSCVVSLYRQSDR